MLKIQIKILCINDVPNWCTNYLVLIYKWYWNDVDSTLKYVHQKHIIGTFSFQHHFNFSNQHHVNAISTFAHWMPTGVLFAKMNQYLIIIYITLSLYVYCSVRKSHDFYYSYWTVHYNAMLEKNNVQGAPLNERFLFNGIFSNRAFIPSEF